MKVTPLKASLVALAVFTAAGAGAAAPASATEPMVLAQADSDFQQVRKFIAGGRNLSRLDEGQLQQRLRRAQRLKQTENLPADLSAALDQEIAEINSALSSRGQAGAAGADNQQQAEGTGEQQPETATKRQRRQQQADNSGNANDTAEGTVQQQAQAGGGGSPEVDSFLQSVQPAANLDQQQLRQQTRRAQQLSRSQGISDEQRRELRRIVREGRSAMQGSGDGGQNQNRNQQAGGGQQGGQDEDEKKKKRQYDITPPPLMYA